MTATSVIANLQTLALMLAGMSCFLGLGYLIAITGDWLQDWMNRRKP